MIELFRPLVAAPAQTMGAVRSSLADPASADGLMMVGVTIVVVAAIWAVGGLVAAVWTKVETWADRRQSDRRDGDKPMRP